METQEKKTYYTEATKKAAEQYKKKNIKRIPFDVQNEEYDKIKAHADLMGESVNGYIKAAIRMRMEQENI